LHLSAAFIWAAAIWRLCLPNCSKAKQADALIVEADISGHETPFANLPSFLHWRNV
jgi:hypothetical protein